MYRRKYYKTFEPGFKAFETGVRHAHFGHIGGEILSRIKDYVYPKKTMAPHPHHERGRTHERETSRTRGASSISMKSQSHYSASEAVGYDDSQFIRNPVVLRHSNKKVHYKKPHEPHVSKSFVKKVEKALEKDETLYHGSFRTFSYDKIDFSSVNFPEGGQRSDIPGAHASIFQSDAWGAVGNVSDWVHMVSVLWNGKADNQQSRDWYNTANLLYNNNSVAASTNAAPLANMGSSSLPLKFTVKKCYDIYRMKNDSERTLKMKIYLCAYKVTTSENNSLSTDASTNRIETPYIQNPSAFWGNSLLDSIREGVNVSGCGNGTFMTSPLECPAWKKKFNAEVTTVVLEPGQTYEYKIEGPSGLHVNCAQMFEQEYFKDIQKFSRMPMFVSHLDLVYGSTAGQGRLGIAPAPSGTADPGLVMEREHFASFLMPESVGLTVNAINSTVTLGLNQRNSRFFHKVYPIAPTGTIKRVDVVAPQPIETE